MLGVGSSDNSDEARRRGPRLAAVSARSCAGLIGPRASEGRAGLLAGRPWLPVSWSLSEQAWWVSLVCPVGCSLPAGLTVAQAPIMAHGDLLKSFISFFPASGLPGSLLWLLAGSLRCGAGEPHGLWTFTTSASMPGAGESSSLPDSSLPEWRYFEHQTGPRVGQRPCSKFWSYSWPRGWAPTHGARWCLSPHLWEPVRSSACTTAQPRGQALGARSPSCWGSGACGWMWQDSLSLGCSPRMGRQG